MPQSCVIIGAGPAGVSTAEALRDNGFTGALTLIGAEPHLPYHRPELSKQILLDVPCPSPTPLHDAAFYRERNIELRLGATVTAITPDRGLVHIRDARPLTADFIVLTTGGSPRPLEIPGSELPGVFVLRQADHAATLRRWIDTTRRVVVIGGGFIGAEVAASAAARGQSSTIVEATELPMSRALGRDAALRLAAAHRRRGITLRCNATSVQIEGTKHVTGVRLANNELLPADLVVVGVGATPNTTLGHEAGVTTGDGIHTDETGRTSHPAVFAAGDAASVARAGIRTRAEHWQQAHDSGRTVARTILGLPQHEPSIPWFWSDQSDINLQLAGRPDISDTCSWRNDPESESFSVLYHRDGALTGIVTLNRGQDVRPAIEMIKRGVPVDHAQLANVGTPLRKLLKRSSGR